MTASSSAGWHGPAPPCRGSFHALPGKHIEIQIHFRNLLVPFNTGRKSGHFKSDLSNAVVRVHFACCRTRASAPASTFCSSAPKVAKSRRNLPIGGRASPMPATANVKPCCLSPNQALQNPSGDAGAASKAERMQRRSRSNLAEHTASGIPAPGITAYIALGSNLSDPVAQIEQAWLDLAQLPETHLAACSSLYLSKPVGYAEQPDFINAAARISTRLPPGALLAALLGIESRHGRNRTFKNAPRSLDLDLLLYDGLVMHEHGLTLPHPRMTERAFVLLPLAEIAADTLIPGHGRVADCLAKTNTHDISRLPAESARAVNG